MSCMQEVEAVNLGQEDGEAANLDDDDEANETRSNAESESITCHNHKNDIHVLATVLVPNTCITILEII